MSQIKKPIDSNTETIQSYNLFVKEYLENTEAEILNHDTAMIHWIKTMLSYITPEDTIFEIGSGTGRDAAFIESLGHKIQRSDASESFRELLHANGHSSIRFNLLTDPFPGQYQAIFANAVFPHFKAHELKKALQKINLALLDNGILAFSVKKGDGQEWVIEKIPGKRFVKYWQVEEISNLLIDTGFSVEYRTEHINPAYNHNWMTIIAKKD